MLLMLRLSPAFRVAVSVGLLVLSAGLFAREPGPYVAVQVDHYAGNDVRAGVDDSRKVSEGRGSGVVVGPGEVGTWLVLTNAHVVESGSDSWVSVPRVYAGGQWRDGTTIAADAKADLALVQVDYDQPLRTIDLAPSAPSDDSAVKTHGFAAGRKYTARDTKLTFALRLEDGAKAFAAQRNFIRTTFMPGESGGAVTLNGELVGLIHGNDPQAERGICVDHAAIEAFLAPHLTEKRTAAAEPQSP